MSGPEYPLISGSAQGSVLAVADGMSMVTSPPDTSGRANAARSDAAAAAGSAGSAGPVTTATLSWPVSAARTDVSADPRAISRIPGSSIAVMVRSQVSR